VVICSLAEAAAQLPPAAGFAKALAFLRRPDLANLPDGRYELDGDSVYAMVQRYATGPGPEPKFEAHRKYIDVQFLAAGAEIIGWAPLGRLAVSEPYDADRDVCFGRVAAGGWTPALLLAGELAVLYPEDAHAPRLAAGGPGAVTKVVVKVAV
jgi:YhcH/YjgK/YiaL family protein